MRVTAAALLCLAAVAPARAQDGAECAVVECARAPSTDASPAIRRLWDAASAAHAIKIEFVEAARRFAVLQASPLATDTAALQQQLAAMRAALVRWDEALQKLGIAATPHLRSAETHVVLGTAALDRHRTGDALRSLTEASRIDTGRADIHAALALTAALAGQEAEVVRELRRATSLDARNPVAVYDLAHAQRLAGRDDEARQALQQVARLRSAVPDTNATPARSQPFERAGLFRQAGGVAPLFALSRYAAGFAQLEAGDYGGAIEALERAVPVDPSPADALRLKGLERWVAGDHNAALRELRQAIDVHAGDERARLALAFVLRAAGRPSEAEQELRAATDAFPRSGLAWYRLGQLYESQSRLADAARAFDASAGLAPVLGRDALYQRLARVRVNQADFAGAIAAYAQRVSVNPNNAEAHRSLGEIYYLQGRDDEALAEFLVAVWLDPMDARALAALGKVQLRAQRYAEAVPVLRRALALDPVRADAHYALGQALARTGRAEDAGQSIAEFERLDAAERAQGQHDFRVEQRRVEAGRLLAAGDAPAAIAVLQSLAAEEPQHPRWPRELGAAFLRARRFAESIAAFEAAQAREPTADTERLLAEAYAAAGRPAEAQAHQARYDDAVRRIRVEQLLTGEL
jgi:tetratricopeptide (TPR) repeat protein